MSVIATIAVPAGDFTLGALLTRNPDIRIRLERVVPVGGSFIPYFWASDDGVDAIEASLESAADIESFRIVDRVDDDALVRIEWAEEVDGLLEALGDTGGTVLDGVGESNRWRFQVRFDAHDALTAFFRRCVDRGITIDLERVHNPGPPRVHNVPVDLTDSQRVTLELALERGYFEVPRRVDLGDLAEELGISDSAVSQRIRRGVSKVLASMTVDPDVAEE